MWRGGFKGSVVCWTDQCNAVWPGRVEAWGCDIRSLWCGPGPELGSWWGVPPQRGIRPDDQTLHSVEERRRQTGETHRESPVANRKRKVRLMQILKPWSGINQSVFKFCQTLHNQVFQILYNSRFHCGIWPTSVSTGTAGIGHRSEAESVDSWAKFIQHWRLHFSVATTSPSS